MRTRQVLGLPAAPVASPPPQSPSDHQLQQQPTPTHEQVTIPHVDKYDLLYLAKRGVRGELQADMLSQQARSMVQDRVGAVQAWWQRILQGG